MADEYFERYKRLSHQELYRMLRAGNVRQVSAVADTWVSIADTLAALSATLTRDLDRLSRSWTGQASREFSVRMSLVAEFAKTLAAEAADIRTGLNAMANALHEAQRQAEAPLADSDREPGDLPAVLGTSVGWALPAQETKRAQERMAWLVARLAAEYGVVAHGTWPSMLSDPPIGLPGVDDVSHVRDHHRKRPHGTVLAAAEPSPVTAAPLPNVSAAQPVRHEQWQAGGLASTPVYKAESTRVSSSSSSSSSSSTSSASGNQPVPMAPPVGMAGASAGAAPGVVPMGAPVTPTNLAWQTAEHVDWSDHDSDDAPPSVLG